MKVPTPDSRGRTLSPEIRVHYHGGTKRPSVVEARFNTKLTYTHPDEAPNYARLTFYRGTWVGDIEFAEFAETELDALRALATMLQNNGFTERPVLRVTIEALEQTTTKEQNQ